MQCLYYAVPKLMVPINKWLIHAKKFKLAHGSWQPVHCEKAAQSIMHLVQTKFAIKDIRKSQYLMYFHLGYATQVKSVASHNIIVHCALQRVI